MLRYLDVIEGPGGASPRGSGRGGDEAYEVEFMRLVPLLRRGAR